MRTPAPPVDVLAAFPELRPLGRTATRLHPRPARVRAEDSHVGGPLLWPAGEPWPWGSLRIFLCHACPDAPFLLDMQ